jgi:hypothetical protein
MLGAALAPPARAAGVGTLAIFGADGSRNTGVAMAPGTSPAIVNIGSGADELAFQGADGTLWSYDDATGASGSAQTAMSAGTSPSIAVTSSGLEIAFVSGGTLETNSGGASTSLGLSVAPGTSPVITSVGGAPRIAFQNLQNNLDLESGGSSSNLTLGMDSASSPAYSAVEGGGFVTAVNANVNSLYQYTGNSVQNDNQGLTAGTSPSACGRAGTDGAFELAYDTNTGLVDTLLGNTGSSSTPNNSTGVAFAAGTSPSVACLPDGGYVVAVNGANGDLWIYTGGAGAIDTGQAVAAGTSPAIAGVDNSYEVAFESPTAPPSTAPSTAPASSAPTATTPVNQTSPTPAGTRSHAQQLKVRLLFSWTWNRSHTQLGKITLVTRAEETKKVTIHVKVRVHGRLRTETRTKTERISVKLTIPRHTTAAITCTGHGCPQIPRPHKGTHTLSELLHAGDHTRYSPGDLLKITLTAPGYRTERVSARILSGHEPRLGVTD